MGVNIEGAVNDAIGFLSNKENLSEEDIDKYMANINVIRRVLNYEEVSEEEKKIISHKIKGRLSHFVLKTDSILKGMDFKPWYKKNKVNISFRYWNRYSQYLLKTKHFSKNVVDNIDDVTDEIVDLIGNPKVSQSFQRRGLIIGDVQSGKTANFIGLMCKASDIGYQLIVVLAGTDNKLRSQTQSRIDEGIIGLDTDKKMAGIYERIGAALYDDDDFAPVNVTSKSKDFNKNTANSLSLKLNQTKEPIVFVIKKNVSVLKNLNSWIKSLNQTDSTGKINSSLLLIDDEADYASINTNKDDCDPTKTNEKIVELLGLFSKNSYVGFTATPYANVFIDPDSIDEMKRENLFPKDYIYCLDSPSNYIGARNIFGDEDTSMLKTIESYDSGIHNEHSIHNILPIKHKKEAEFEEVPDTLKIAIIEFFLGNTIRDLRGDKTSHRSMMINISRFVKVHEKIRATVDKYVKSLSRSIVLYSKQSGESWEKDNNMMLIYKVYNSEYKKVCEDTDYAKKNDFRILNWELIKNSLYESTATIVIRVVNQKSRDSFDYSENEEEGLRVIAIGGIGLSRGLTLEGLMVSYFFRHSIAYDTLMQMGRWFGYRDGYKDLCRIWMTDQMQECYYSINQATEELRESIIRYKNSGNTPLDFGIRVRTDNNLLITARNKMRTAKEQLVECTLSSKVIETPMISSNEEIIKSNFAITDRFLNDLYKVHNCKFDNKRIISPSIGFHDVDYKLIIDYIRELKLPMANLEYQNDALINFIEDNVDNLSTWDIAIIQGRGKKINIIDGKYSTSIVTRIIDIKPGTDLIRISGKRRRVGGPNDGAFGLKEKHNFASQIKYFDMERKPLLCIYLIEAKPAQRDSFDDENRYNKAKKIENISKSTPLVSVSVGIPKLGKKEKYIKYATNKVQQGIDQLQYEFGDEDDEE